MKTDALKYALAIILSIVNEENEVHTSHFPLLHFYSSRVKL